MEDIEIEEVCPFASGSDAQDPTLCLNSTTLQQPSLNRSARRERLFGSMNKQYSATKKDTTIDMRRRLF
jgi:hypothetical protein